MAIKTITDWVNYLSIVLLFTTVSCASQTSNTMGLKDGKLRPCPDKPNCVSSDHMNKASWVDPLSYSGTPDDAWKRLKKSVIDIGGKIEKEEAGYLWATFRSKIFRFVDDMEFRMDAENNFIHLRSASRVGYSDLGVNKKRVEKLRFRFNQEAPDK